MIFDKDIWLSWWKQFQLDVADTLQNNIFNFASLVALISLYIKLFHPMYSKEVDNFMMSYLLVAGKSSTNTKI